MRRRALLTLPALALALAAAAPASAQPFAVGITDPLFQSTDASERVLWLDRAVESNASTLLIGAPWGAIAPTDPEPGFDASDPAAGGYAWGQLDAAVRDASARGLEPMLTVTAAPLWAEGPNRPSQAKAPLGSWKPDPRALGRFAEAIAHRYSGTYVDPTDPEAGPLPRVYRFQAWAEANRAVHLAPQFADGKPFAPSHYRKMLRFFYEGVHRAVPDDIVVTTGTAPYGDPGNDGERMQPVRFWRELLCLKGAKRLRRTRCGAPAEFDVWAHNPINVGRPGRHAINRDDASTPDLGRIGRVVKKAVKVGTALPRARKPLYATEIWWDSDPPDPRGVPARKHARWLAESFYLLWQQGAERVYWFQIRDPASNGDHGAVTESGLYLHDGEPKLAQRSFRFPFATGRAGSRGVRAWGLAPEPGRVRIERRAGAGGWRRAGSARTDSSGVFTALIRAGRGTQLRARIGDAGSVPFVVK